MKTFAGEPTDRMPVSIFISDQGHFLEQCYPDADPSEYLDLQRKVADLQREFGADVFVRMLFGISDPLHMHMGGVDITHQTDQWQVKTTETRQGNTRIARSVIHTPEGELTQETRVVELSRGTFLYAPTEKPVKEERDLDLLIAYEPRMPKGWGEGIRQRVRQIKTYVGNDGIVAVWAPHGPFNNASLLIDQEELYSLFLTEPEYYGKLMRYASDRIVDYTRAMAQSGADVLCVGGNVPGGFLGKRIYDEYVLSYEREYIAICQETGVPAMYHNCGQIMNLAESYKRLGAHIVEPFAPPPLGDADLKKAKEIVDGGYVMVAGVDQVHVLQNGTAEDVRNVTKETALIAKQGGKAILQSADFLEKGTPVENVRAFVETGIRHAAY